LTNITDLAAFKQKVKVVFVSYGSRETRGAASAKANANALKEAKGQGASDRNSLLLIDARQYCGFVGTAPAP
jgi:hypothetical protein